MAARLHACQALVASAMSGAVTAGGAKARANPFSAISVSSSARQVKRVGAARQLLAERDPGHRAVIGRDRHAHTGPMERGQRVLGERGDDAGLDVRGRAQVEGDVAGAEQVEQRGVVDRGHPVGDATDPEVEHLAHALRAGHLARVGRQRQAGLARGDEGDGVRRCGPGGLGSGEVEADDRAADRPGGARQLGVGRRRVLSAWRSRSGR